MHEHVLNPIPKQQQQLCTQVKCKFVSPSKRCLPRKIQALRFSKTWQGGMFYNGKKLKAQKNKTEQLCCNMLQLPHYWLSSVLCCYDKCAPN